MEENYANDSTEKNPLQADIQPANEAGENKAIIDESRNVTSENLPAIVQVIGQDKSDIFSIPFNQYHGKVAQYPIGVFDSGIGGMTVLEAILKIDRFDNTTHKANPDGKPDFMTCIFNGLLKTFNGSCIFTTDVHKGFCRTNGISRNDHPFY